MDTLSEYSVPNAANSVCAGDLDLDGFTDIVVGNNYNVATHWSGLSFLHNLGWGSFTFSDSIYSYGWQWVTIAQLDDDPHPEVIFKKENPIIPTEYIGIIFNNDFNDTVFLDTHTYSGIEFLATGDIDGNGYNDIVFASNQGLFWGVFYNYGNRNFSSPEIHHVNNYYPSGLAVDDLNNDGRDDIVLCGQIIDVYFSYPSGFQRLQLSADGFAGGVAITDFDQDGYKDILGNSGSGSTALIMYKNNGNNTFQKLPDFVFQPSTGQFFVADFNNDGLPDVIFQKQDLSGYILWYNQGNFQLANSQFIAVPTYGEVSRSFYCADLDNNGFKDIITVRCSYEYQLTFNVDIRFNDGNGNFVPDPVVGIQNKKDIVFSLKNYPNPFQDETNFQFYIKETESVDLSVFDIQGNFITCLINQQLKGGSYTIKWHGLDQDGQSCMPGAFIAYLKVNGKIKGFFKVLKT